MIVNCTNQVRTSESKYQNKSDDSHGPRKPETHYKLLKEANYRIETYPTSLINLLVAIGNIVPPKLDPVAITPRAIPRRFLNQCEVTPIAGPKVAPQPS